MPLHIKIRSHCKIKSDYKNQNDEIILHLYHNFTKFKMIYLVSILFLEKVTYYFSVESPAKPTPIHQEIKTWKDEIYVVTGPAKMVPPLSDYLAFEAGCITPFDIVFRRVIEMGDFPKELKTSDLESVLHSGLVKIKNYYDLRWVDDNHALVIFSDESTASKVKSLSNVLLLYYEQLYQSVLSVS